MVPLPQSRLAQRRNMPLQHRWVFDGHSLPVSGVPYELIV
jgi:hypothetical protein